MNKMLRLFGAIAFAAVMIFSVAACSGKKDAAGGGSAAAERNSAGSTLSFKYGTWVKDDDNSTSFSFEKISGQRLSTFKLNGEQIIFQTYNAVNDEVNIHVGPGFDDQIVVKAEFSSDETKMYVSDVAYTGSREGTRDFSAANGTYTLAEQPEEQ